MSSTAPIIINATYDGATVKVRWTPSSDTDVVGYVIQVSATAGNLVIESEQINGQQATFGTLVPEGPLNSASGYTVAVQAIWDSGPGDVSTVLALLTMQPRLDVAWYDGTVVHAEWTPSPAAAQGYLLKIYSLDSGATYTATVTNPYASSGTIPASSLPAGGLGASEQWLVAVCAQGADGVSACTASVPLPQPLPTFSLLNASYLDGRRIVSNWGALGNTFARYRMLVESAASAERWFVDISGGVATGGTLALPAPLAPTQTYTLRVLALTASGVGVATPANALITALPQLVGAETAAGAVALSWNGSIDSAVQGYRLSVMSLASGQTWSADVAATARTGSVTTGTLDTAQQYIATVAATATSLVAGAGTSLPLLAASPAVTAAGYDTRSIAVAWTPSAGAQGYVVSLLVGDTVTQSVAVENPLANSTTLALATPLPNSGEAAVRITAVDAAGARARGEDLALLLVPPPYRYVTYDGTQVLVGWQALAGVARYEFVLTGTASGVRYAATFDSGSADSGLLPLPGRLGAQEVYCYTLTAYATSGASVTAPTLVLPTALPTLDAAIFDGSTVRLRWHLPAGQAAVATGFEAAVVSLDSGAAKTVRLDDPAAREAVLQAPDGGFDPLQSYVARVSALSPGTARAQSADVTLIVALPTIGDAAYYGDRIVASWSHTGDPARIANYRLGVASTQDASSWHLDVPALATFATLGLPHALSATQTYTVSVAAVAADGIAQAVATASPVIADRPVLESVVLQADKLAMTWLPSAGASGYTLKLASLADEGTAYTQAVGADATSGAIPLPASLDASQAWVAQVWADGTVPGVSDRTIVLAAQPVLRAVRYDGRIVEAEWTAVAPGSIAGQTGVSLAVTSSGAIVANAVVTGSGAAVAVPDGVNAPAVQLAYLGPGSTGLATTAVNLLASRPEGFSAQTDPVSGALTLSWTAVAGASAYRITRDDGTAVGQSATTTFAFATPPAANVPYPVVITPIATAGDVSVTGPASLPFALPTGRGAITTANYTIDALTVQWSAVPGASAYRLSILEGEASAPVAQATTAGATKKYTFSPDITDYDQEYRVVVQAMFGNDSGPASESVPLFAAGWYPSNAAATTYAPFVYPAQRLATAMSPDVGTSGGDLTLYLPDIGAGTALHGLPVQNGPFTLDVADTPGDAYPYKLVLSGTGDDNVWAFSTSPIRTGLASSYVAFIQAIETAGSAASGTVFVQQAIARYLPQTFQETLYYSYGLAFPNPDLGIGYGYADLRPGMVLRVVFNDYMAVGGTNVPQWLNGYVGGSQIDYDVGGYLGNNGWALGFDAFIAQLVANGALAVSAPPTHPSQQLEGGSAEAADLFYPDFREPFYRVFFPSTLVSPSGTGTSQTSPNFVLAAASSFTTLSSATNVPGPGSTLAYFRGRAVIKLCIRVTIDGNEIVVPIGTTVGNVLERYSRQPPIVGRELAGLKLDRALLPASPAGPDMALLDVAATYPVRLDWRTLPVYAPGWSALSLPLLHGDRLTIER